MIYARIPAPTHPWKRLGMPHATSGFLNKKVHFVNVSFCFPRLTDYSPCFEYKSTPFCSAHILWLLCYQDSDLIVGVYSTFYDWVCLNHHFVIMRMLIMCCHGEVISQESVSHHSTPLHRLCAHERYGLTKALGHEKLLLFRERFLEANNLIVGSSFCGSGNEDSHWVDYSRAEGPCLLLWVRPWYSNDELMRGMAKTCALIVLDTYNHWQWNVRWYWWITLITG